MSLADTCELQHPAKLVDLKPDHMLRIEVLGVIFVEARPGVPELGGVPRPVHRADEREKKAGGAVGVATQGASPSAANAIKPVDGLDLRHVSPRWDRRHASRSQVEAVSVEVVRDQLGDSAGMGAVR